ncbi:MAG: DNA gyrase inhibitor YacG [Kordiimonadaceae bacterium]|nr:DNA gyrase inhibitor YacG [Kordiimonadaceae bacterium]
MSNSSSKADDKTPNVKLGKCPECAKPAVHKSRPFCSDRCANLDLGKWFNEGYTLPGDSEIPDDITEH